MRVAKSVLFLCATSAAFYILSCLYMLATALTGAR